MPKIKISELPEFDVVDYLTNETEIAAYLTVVREDNDPELLARALNDVARARARYSLVENGESKAG